MWRLAAMAVLLVVCSCSPTSLVEDPSPGRDPSQTVPTPSNPGESGQRRVVRLSGVLEAVRLTRVVVPQLSGPTRRLTLTRIVPNGVAVEAGDIVAEFAGVEEIDLARASAASYEDLSFQVRQREAENVANVERRRSELQDAEAELAKALLEVSKAPILSEIEAAQNQIRARKAQLAVDSLRLQHAENEREDAAALRILELQRDRQRSEFERAEGNLEKLRVAAPIAGMVALETRYSGGNVIRPQMGDQMNRNNALMSIFDPGEMQIRASVAEPDGALLQPGIQARVYIDAYPDLELDAELVAASPVAMGALGNPIKSFSAVFRLVESDARLMPDLSAAVVIDVRPVPESAVESDAGSVPDDTFAEASGTSLASVAVDREVAP